jgi:hypothetical protein
MLSPAQQAELSRLIQADLTQAEFEQMLGTDVRVKPGWQPLATVYSHIVAEVLDAAVNDGWIESLLTALLDTYKAVMAGPYIAQLVYQQTGATGLQRLIEPVDATYDWGLRTSRMPVIARHVCMVEIDNTGVGTGLLVGPDIVLTAYHVVEHLLHDGGPGAGSDQRLRVVFDFLRVYASNGMSHIAGGARYSVSAQWHELHSPYYVSERAANPLPPPDDLPVDQLDYVVIRLGSQVGLAPIPDLGTQRGWTELKPPAIPLAPFLALNISQHPRSQPLRGSVGRVTRLPGHGARLRYTASTTPASSGSPCWNNEFELVALHNFGGIPTQKGFENQGVPISRIVADIQARRGANFLTSAPPHPPVSPGTAPVPTPLSRMWTLGSDYPVLDRSKLQELVARVAGNGAVLSVRGGRGTGRSFSVDVVQHMLRPRGHVAIPINGIALADKTPEAFMAGLRSKLGLQIRAPAEGSEFTTRTAQIGRNFVDDFLNDLREKYSRGNDQIWLLFDGLDQTELPDETHQIIAEMASRCGEVPALRLVMLGYNRELPARVEDTAETEDIETLSETHIEDHIRYICEVKRVSMPAPELTRLAGAALAASGEDVGKRLRKIANSVRAICKKLENT